MERYKKYNILRFTGFMLLTVLVIGTLCLFVRPANEMDYADNRSYEAYRVYDEPENTIDVIMLGHSGIYRGVSPMEMFKEYGFTSYACSRATQLPWESYEFLKSVLEKQSPKLVLFETDQLFYDKGTNAEENYKQNRIDSIIPIIKNHASWKDWLPGKNYRERSYTKGYKFIKNVKPYTGNKQLTETEKAYKIKKDHLKSLNKIYKLCKEKNIPLFLVEIPSKILWDYEKYNAVKEYADNRGIKFIDCNQHLEEFDFDWKNDTYDAGDHLNYYGARKLSLYVGKYIKEEFSLPDRRDNDKYYFWQEDLKKYIKYVENAL